MNAQHWIGGTGPIASDRRSGPAALAEHWRWIAFAAAFALGIAARMRAGWSMPLWFDETFTGLIAMQDGLAGLWHWCRTELTGPAYYMPLWAWEKLAGPGNIALRLPSFAMAVAAPLWLFLRGHPDRDIRLCWAVLAALWLPGFGASVEARPYAQLFLLGALQAGGFIHLLRRPSIRTGLAWSIPSALAVLTNYHALVITGLQGLAILLLRPREARRAWPAGLPFVPMFAWMALHLPFVLAYAGSGATWYDRLTADELLRLPAYLFHDGLLGMALLGIVAITGWGLRPRPALRSPEAWLAATGMLAFAIVFATGFFRSSFTPRYVTPFMPAVLFALAWWGGAMLRRDWRPVALVGAALAWLGVGALLHPLTGGPEDGRRLLSIERASAWIGERHPQRLAFLWSGRLGDYSDEGNIAEMAGFFLHREGQRIPVTVVRGRGGAEASRALRREMDGRTALLWLSTDPTADPPRRAPPDRIAPGMECRDFGGDYVFACRPPARLR